MAGSAGERIGSAGTRTGKKKLSVKERFTALPKAAVQDLRDIVTALPKLPAALVEEALALGATVSGTSQLPSQKLHIPHIGTVATNPNVAARESIKQGFAKGGGKGVGQVLQSPGVRLIPGTYVASNVVAGTPEVLLERPLMAALDVLPYVGKATRVATKGGTLATRATARAEQVGKLAKAERITQRGLEPRQLFGEVARSAEESLIRAKPSLTPLAPSRLMEVSGLGGNRLRQFMTTMGVADREFATQAKSLIDDTMHLADEFQVSPQRIKQITDLGESGAPNWRESLQPNEQSWLSALETKSNEFTQHQLAKGKLFEFGGEVYPVAGQKRLLVAKNRLDKATRAANKPQGATSRRRALTEQKAALAETERLATNATPARFVPALNSQVKKSIANLAHGKLDEVDIGEVTRHYLQGDLKATAASLGEAEVKQLAKDIHVTWQDLRSAGHDPLYLHHVSPSQAKKELLRPKLSREIRSPSFVKNRSMNMEPSVNDLAVGVSAMGVEHLRPIYAKRLWNELREKRFLFTRQEAINDIRPLIQSDIAKGLGDTTNSRLAQMYGTFAPERMFPVGKGTRARSGEWYLPKGLHRALTGEKIGILKQADLGPLAKVTSIPMSIFRMSILGLNPSYYIGNLVSGAVMLAAHNPLALKFFPKAIRMIRNGEIPKELSIGWREGSAEQAQALGRFKAAGELGDILTKADQAKGLKPVAMQVGKKVIAVPQWLNKMASSIDDMYKVMGYLSEQKKGLRQGLSKEAAHQAGIELAHKVLVDFDRMTPLERTAIRSVMPFASWCVDNKTEALTKRGWVSGNEITEHDEVLSMNQVGRMVWSPVRSVFRNEGYRGKMYRLDGQAIDALVTPGHKFPLTDGRLLPVEGLRQHHVLQLMGSAVEDTEQIYSDAFVEVVGWAVTEGHYKRNGSGNVTTIEISQKASSPKCELIRSALKRAGARWHEFLAGQDHLIRYFGVTGVVAKQIQEVAPKRVMKPEFLISLAKDQRTLLLEAMILADGSIAARAKSDRPTFVQKSPEAMDAFVMLASLAGITTYTRKVGTGRGTHCPPDHDHGQVLACTLRSTKTAQVRQIKGWSQRGAGKIGARLAPRTTETYEGLVWCPETDYGTFVCRRGGKVYVTGNTSHILRYTLSYPFDHPWRAAIVSSLARNISNEWPEGLPERFKKDLFLDDNSKRFTLGNYIPMMNVPDIFSVSGLFSRLNPALQTLMEYSGSDPFTYAAPVFGARETEFDPVSGRRVGKRPSLVGKALEISPQVHQVWAVLSKDPEWQRLKEANPEAARAAAWRAFGITLPRDLDIDKEIAKARKDEAAQARADAKKQQEARGAVSEDVSSGSSGGAGARRP